MSVVWLLLHIILVKVVALEELLDAVPAQLYLLLFDRLCVLPLLIVDVVGVEIVHVDIRDKFRLHGTGGERCPVEVSKPGVLFKFLSASLVANPVDRLPL